ncbi:MAG: SDR family NAD(P)-dependent oxidoreductase, partial [Pseudomonadota bacterium]
MDKPVAVVTGGSAGIGASICRHLLAADYRVISFARRAGEVSHDLLETVQVDLADVAATREAAAEVARCWPVTSLVHNAGVIRPALIEEAKAEEVVDRLLTYGQQVEGLL